MTWAEDTARALGSSPLALAMVVALVAVVAGRVAARVLRGLMIRIARRTAGSWDDVLADQLASPASALITVQLCRVALSWISLGADAAALLRDIVAILTIAIVLWGTFRAIDLGKTVLAQRSWALERPASRSLLALGGRFTKVTVLVLGALVALAQVGVSIASLIAGLGIGGLVIALAAQKTVENVFGAVSIGVDQPMREGDFIHVYDLVGTVETIGLRSTRIRTLDRTVVTIPNGELANQRIESYTARDRIRLACTIGVEYGTTLTQLRSVISDLERTLRAHPKIWPDVVVVKFKQFAESSLDIEIMAWFLTTDFGEFQAIRQEILFGFMDAIERAGASVAFPTRTVHLFGGSQQQERLPHRETDPG